MGRLGPALLNGLGVVANLSGLFRLGGGGLGGFSLFSMTAYPGKLGSLEVDEKSLTSSAKLKSPGSDSAPWEVRSSSGARLAVLECDLVRFGITGGAGGTMYSWSSSSSKGGGVGGGVGGIRSRESWTEPFVSK